MTIDPPRPGPAGEDRAGSGLGRVLGRLRRTGPAERITILSIGGRAIRVAVREGRPGWPPLLLCNGLGANLELLQPFVDALDPRRPVIRFDMPGIGGSPAPVIPYQLVSGLGWTSLPRLPKLRPPTLILAGDDDPIIPLVNARIMHRLIPRSQLHIYHGGHLELAADSERLASAVEAFLDADPTAEGSQQ